MKNKMKKRIFIVAGVLAVSGVAFIYFSKKKKQSSQKLLGASEVASTSQTTKMDETNPIKPIIPSLSTGGIVKF